MHQSLKDQLKDWKKLHQEPASKKKPHQKPQKRRTEHLSDSDIKSLMGIDRPTYKRHKGAIRQK